MKNTVKIRIDLDPVNDGVVIGDAAIEKNKRFVDVAGIVLSTDNRFRLIKKEEALELLFKLGDANYGFFEFDEFVCVYNKDKVLNIDGDSYFAGSVLIMKRDDYIDDLGEIDEECIPTILEEIGSRIVDISNGDQYFSAIML